jgi:hypothetical protein
MVNVMGSLRPGRLSTAINAMDVDVAAINRVA